jgi:hypothetical protein
MSAFVSLDGATTLGPGQERQLQMTTAHHTMAISLTGEPTNCVVILEGSHDGYNWFPMGTQQLYLIGGVKTVQPGTHLFNHVRANLTELDGGTNPTVTVSIASADGA